MDSEIARLMAMSEAEVDAELRRMGMDPAETAEKGSRAVRNALAIFHITRALVLLENSAIIKGDLLRGHLTAARDALRPGNAGVPQLKRHIDTCPELNLSNFSTEDVERLNLWAVLADAELDRLVRTGNRGVPERRFTGVGHLEATG